MGYPESIPIPFALKNSHHKYLLIYTIINIEYCLCWFQSILAFILHDRNPFKDA